MLSNRIRLARQASALSLQQLAERMSSLSLPITKAALSNYETGKNLPNAQSLAILASALGTTMDFLQREDWEDFDLVLLSHMAPLPDARKAELTAYVQVELERYLLVSDLFGESHRLLSIAPKPVNACNMEAIRRICADIRREWNIGGYAIQSVCSLLESHGWLLLSLPDSFGHINFSGIERSRQLQFIFYTPTPFLDEFRLTMLRELGRLYLSFSAEDEDEVLSYFARELLFPQELVVQEFGSTRTRVLEEELDRAKQKYGVARRNVMLRLKESGVITDTYYNSFLLYLNQNSFMRREVRNTSSQLCFFEEPTAYTSRVAKAKAEKLLSVDTGWFFL